MTITGATASSLAASPGGGDDPVTTPRWEKTVIARIAFVMTALAMKLGPAALAQDRTVPVRFQPGATSATVKGAIHGDRGINYTFETVAGQTLQLLFTPSNRSCTVNVYAPGGDEAVHIGSVAGNEFGQTATQAGTYRAQISLMRNAARRNETCRHTLSIELTGRPGGSSAGVSDAMLRDRCRAEAAPMYGVAPRRISLAGRITPSTEGGLQIDGTVDKGREGVKKLRCLFNRERGFDRVMAMTPDGL